MHATEDEDDMRQTDDGSGNGPAREHPWGDHDGPAWLDDAQRMAQRARVWVIGNPFAAMGVALAAGFLVGRVARRIG